MIAKMKLLRITGTMKTLDHVVRLCGKSRSFQCEDAASFFSDTSHFLSMKEENPYEEPLKKLEAAIARTGGTPVFTEGVETYAPEELTRYTDTFCTQINEWGTSYDALAARKEELDKQLELYEHFRGLDVDLKEVLSCQTIKARFGRLPKESYQKLGAYSENPYVLFFPAASDECYYWGVYFCPVDYRDEIDRIFSGLYFERLMVPNDTPGTPDEIIGQLHTKLSDLNAQEDTIRQEMAACGKKETAAYNAAYSQLRELSFYFGIRRYALRQGDTFILTGWVPEKEADALSRDLGQVESVTCAFDQPDSQHVPPVKMQNPSLFRPFEYLVQMYGIPRYGEMDPTIWVGITYTLLFGIMFADVGQGLCVAIAGWLMWKLSKNGIGRILVPCGISSMVFGVVFGSVFGFEHALDPLYHAVFGLKEKPIDVMDSQTTIMIILAAVGIGIVIILLSMLFNIYSGLKRHDYENALFGASGLAGFVFFGALIAGFGGQVAFKWKLMTTPYIVCLIVLPLLLMFLREPLGKLVSGEKHWMPEKIGEFILQNFFEMFETLLSYLSNTMSFMRVGAFVLVHAGMMMAVFSIAKLFGTFGYINSVVLGNLLVMAMEAVLVAIQVMRLEFYEMFSRYYIGDGQLFTPFTLSESSK